MEQPAYELEIVPWRAHDRRDRSAACPQLEWCLDDDAIAVFPATIAVESLDRDLADLAHDGSLVRTAENGC